MQPEFMYPAIAARDVDVIAAYSSDGLISKYDLVVLDDPKGAIPPYDAILLVSPKRANDAKLADTLRPLLGAIDVTLMRQANLRASDGTVQMLRPMRRRAGCGSRLRSGRARNNERSAYALPIGFRVRAFGAPRIDCKTITSRNRRRHSGAPRSGEPGIHKATLTVAVTS